MDMSEGLSVYQKRLLTCAAIVRNGKTPFSMFSWESKTPCGTTHCAIGDYCLAGVSEMRLKRMTLGSVVPMLPNGRQGFDAVIEEFGIKRGHAEELFGPLLTSSRKRVADRIETFALHEHADAVKVSR